MKIAMRVDASSQIGNGHLMRCLTLGQTLAKHGCEISIISKSLPQTLTNLIDQYGFELHTISAETQRADLYECLKIAEQQNFDTVLVDHYALGEAWETPMRNACGKLIAIDDLANRKHVCDIVLDQTLNRTPEAYRALVPDECTILTGIEYALLRPEFTELRKQVSARKRQSEIQNILLTLGGSDANAQLQNILQRLSQVEFAPSTQLTILNPYPNRETVRLAKGLGISVRHMETISDMAEQLANTDLAIGAAGTSTWERCCLGVPSYLFVIADNQRMIGEEIAKSGAAFVIKDANELFAGDDTPCSPLFNARLTHMSQIATTLVDGLGAQRSADQILERLQ